MSILRYHLQIYAIFGHKKIASAQKIMNERSLISQRGLKNFQMSARTKISTWVYTPNLG